MDDSVFPAYAGVILMNSNRESLIRGFPRVCGGDPKKYCIIKRADWFSPRMRG